jgi:hypothetical protein
MRGAEFQTVARMPGPVKVDMGLEIVATHSFDNGWSDPDVFFVPGGGIGAFNALQAMGCLTRSHGLAAKRSG